MITDYNSLQSEIATFLQRGDLTARIPTLIQLFEARLNRVTRDLMQDLKVSDTLLSGTSQIALPASFYEILNISANIDGVPEPVEKAQAEFFDETYVLNTYPSHYNIVNGVINFDCVADKDYPINVRYLKGWSLASTLTNTLLTQNPDLYLYGSLAIAELYIKNDPRVSLWKQLASEAIVEINQQSSRNRKAKLKTGMAGNRYNINSDQ